MAVVAPSPIPCMTPVLTTVVSTQVSPGRTGLSGSVGKALIRADRWTGEMPAARRSGPVPSSSEIRTSSPRVVIRAR